jgi:hypothetical protein
MSSLSQISGTILSKAQLNINHPGVVWLAAVLNYVPWPSMSAVLYSLQAHLFVSCNNLESQTPACLVVCILALYSGAVGYESQPADSLP